MNGLDIRAERKWMESHPGQVLDEVSMQPAEYFDPVARQRIVALEEQVSQLPQYTCPLKHYFVDGIYVREIFIPAGCVLVGYIHTQPCITTLSQGTILISEGGKTVRLSAPFTATVAPGSKKAGYALTDCVWSDAYLNPDNEHDIEKLESRLTANTHEQYIEYRDARLLLENP